MVINTNCSKETFEATEIKYTEQIVYASDVIIIRGTFYWLPEVPGALMCDGLDGICYVWVRGEASGIAVNPGSDEHPSGIYHLGSSALDDIIYYPGATISSEYMEEGETIYIIDNPSIGVTYPGSWSSFVNDF
jgi:hypothetical protein